MRTIVIAVACHMLHILIACAAAQAGEFSYKSGTSINADELRIEISRAYGLILQWPLTGQIVIGDEAQSVDNRNELGVSEILGGILKSERLIVSSGDNVFIDVKLNPRESSDALIGVSEIIICSVFYRSQGEIELRMCGPKNTLRKIASCVISPDGRSKIELKKRSDSVYGAHIADSAEQWTGKINNDANLVLSGIALGSVRRTPFSLINSKETGPVEVRKEGPSVRVVALGEVPSPVGLEVKSGSNKVCCAIKINKDVRLVDLLVMSKKAKFLTTFSSKDSGETYVEYLIERELMNDPVSVCLYDEAVVADRHQDKIQISVSKVK